MGLERLVEEQPQDYIGKDALGALRREGRRPQARRASIWTATSCAPRCPSTGRRPRGRQAGRTHDGRGVVAGAASRTSGTCGSRSSWPSPGNALDVESENGSLTGTTAAIPFVDPKKEVPAGALACSAPNLSRTLTGPGTNPGCDRRESPPIAVHPVTLISEVPRMRRLLIPAWWCSPWWRVPVPFTVGSESPSPARPRRHTSTPPRCRYRPTARRRRGAAGACRRSST